MSLKSSTDLDASKTRIKIQSDAAPEPPINYVTSRLTVTDGELLEMMTRANPSIFQASSLALVYSNTFGIPFVHDQVAQLMRLAVSADGEGRRELIDALKAGGTLPAEYYASGGGSGWGEIRTVREESDGEDGERCTPHTAAS